MPKYAYLCDGTACDRQCVKLPKEEWDKLPCHYTTDEKFAKNKCRRKRKFKTQKLKNGEIGFTEVE